MATASGFSPTAPGGPPPLSELNIVLLGKVGAGKSKVAKALLEGKEVNEASDQCVLYDNVEEGRKICVVDTPGWDDVSIYFTSETVKNEIIKSVTLCPPGPHALILVLPVTSLNDIPTANEFINACHHMELLSKRVWKYSMVVFCCNNDVEKSVFKEHITNAAKPLENCDHRYCVLRNVDSKTERQELLMAIRTMVHGNHGEIFHLHDVDREETVHEKPYVEESEEKVVIRHRRGSLEGVRPNMKEEPKNVDSPSQTTETTKSPQLISSYNIPRQVAVILIGVVGALIGAVAGATYGTVGAALGIVVGFLVGILVAYVLFVLKII